MVTDRTVRRRVNRGIKLLKQYGYNIADVNLGILSMGSCTNCAVAQLTGDVYENGAKRIGIDIKTKAGQKKAVSHGFFSYDSLQLGRAWRKKIAKAQQKGCVTPNKD